MQVTMSMEEYEDLTFKNERVIEGLKETYNAEILAMQNRLMLEIRKLKSDKERLESNLNNKGCEFCKKEKKWLWGAWTEVRIEDGKLKTYAPEDDEIHVDDFKINYCPMCGKKLA